MFFIFLLIANSATAQPVTTPPVQPEWYDSALRFIPDGCVGGNGYGPVGNDASNTKDLTGYIAVYPKGAGDPKTPASAFDTGSVIVVKFARQDGELTALSGELRPRDSKLGTDIRGLIAAQDDVDYDTLNTELLAKAKSLAAGTMPCDLRGWSEDKDPKGLNVRAEPNVNGKILGTLPPPYNFKKSSAPDSGWQTEFSIIGFREGWFLIDGAQPPGQDYEAENYPRNHPQPYAGRGWVAANKVAQFANGNTRMGGLYQAPHTDAKWTPALNESGSEISADGGPKRISACSGFWALVESHNGVRGWWRRLCSNQVTNCS